MKENEEIEALTDTNFILQNLMEKKNHIISELETKVRLLHKGKGNGYHYEEKQVYFPPI
jgi:hypothetical protein